MSVLDWQAGTVGSRRGTSTVVATLVACLSSACSDGSTSASSGVDAGSTGAAGGTNTCDPTVDGGAAGAAGSAGTAGDDLRPTAFVTTRGRHFDEAGRLHVFVGANFWQGMRIFSPRIEVSTSTTPPATSGWNRGESTMPMIAARETCKRPSTLRPSTSKNTNPSQLG